MDFEDAPAAAMLGTGRWRSRHRRPGHVDRAHVDGSGNREPGDRARPRSGRSTTPQPTLTPCTSTRSSSRSSTGRPSSWTRTDEIIQVVPARWPDQPPEPWETGFKDTVIAYPGQVTAFKAQFTTPGQFVWHCHIVEHEDNEMMRPYRIGPEQPGQPM